MLYVPGLKFQAFIDRTVKWFTVHEPEKLDIKYDYWFAGLFVGVLIGIII